MSSAALRSRDGGGPNLRGSASCVLNRLVFFEPREILGRADGGHHKRLAESRLAKRLKLHAITRLAPEPRNTSEPGSSSRACDRRRVRNREPPQGQECPQRCRQELCALVSPAEASARRIETCKEEVRRFVFALKSVVCSRIVWNDWESVNEN